jgi:hypothetical protein
MGREIERSFHIGGAFRSRIFDGAPNETSSREETLHITRA